MKFLCAEFTTVTLIDLARPDLPRTSRCFAGASEALHLSGRHLVLAQTNMPYTLTEQGPVYANQARTQVHLLTLEGGTLAWQASGEVPGHLGWDRVQAPYRLSVHNGDVRVLSYTGAAGWVTAPASGNSGGAPSPATLTILRPSASTAGRLEVLASLPNPQQPRPLGKPGEQLYGVRFVGDRAYAVTFRITDPLYVIDLADPKNPRVAGELELPGFSDHLLPLPEGLLLGVGHDATAAGQRAGVQLALFDVRDAARPALLQRLSLGAAGSLSVLDFGRQGLSLSLRDQVARLALPVALTGSDWGPHTGSLQTATIDLRARTLARGATLGARSDGTQADLWHQRSLQIGDQLYWLRDGAVIGLTWPGR